jgi:hypothetical protein
MGVPPYTFSLPPLREMCSISADPAYVLSDDFAPRTSGIGSDRWLSGTEHGDCQRRKARFPSPRRSRATYIPLFLTKSATRARRSYSDEAVHLPGAGLDPAPVLSATDTLAGEPDCDQDAFGLDEWSQRLCLAGDLE